MPDNKGKDITLALQGVLESITPGAGYTYDASSRVYRGRRVFDWNDLELFPAFTVFSYQESLVAASMHQGGRLKQRMNVAIEAHCVGDADNPGDSGQDLYQDIKRAVALQIKADYTLGGLAEQILYDPDHDGSGAIMLPEEPADHIVSVLFTCAVDYRETIT